MRALHIGAVFLLAGACTPPAPFPGASLFRGPDDRYHLFLITPPWDLVEAGLPRVDIPPADDRADFAIFTEGPLGNIEPVAVAGLSIYPPAPFSGGLVGATEARRAEIEADDHFGSPEAAVPFTTSAGAPGLVFSFLESQVIFHREFFVSAPDGAVARLFYVSARDLEIPEVDAMTQTFTFGPPEERE